MHERYSILKKQVEKIWTICQLSLNYNFQMMKLSYCLYHKMAAECIMSNEPLSGSTASCTWCQGLKHRTPLLKQNHVVAVGPGLSYVSQTISLIHKAWVISLNLFHDYFCSARSSDPLPGLLLLWGAGRHGGVAVSGSSHPPPHTRTKPQLRLEGDAPARMTSVWSKLHRTLILLSSRGQQRPHNTETFSLSASPHSCWVSSDGWRGFPPEDEKPRPQPVNGRPTECIPLRPHSDFIVLLCFLEEWGWVGVRCAVWESAHWNPAARFSLRKCCEISMFPNSAAENQSYQHECISWRTTDCDSGWQ